MIALNLANDNKSWEIHLMGEDIKDTLQQREKSHEAKFKMDQELRFKAESRRNKLLGLWAAEKMGMTPGETETFAKDVVVSDLQEPGPGDVIRKVLGEFEKRKVKMSEQDITKQMDRLESIAIQQIADEYPEALGPDHERVGD